MKILTNCVICKRLRHGCAPLCALFINGSYAHMGALYANLEKGAKRRITLQKLHFRAKHFIRAFVMHIWFMNSVSSRAFPRDILASRVN